MRLPVRATRLRECVQISAHSLSAWRRCFASDPTLASPFDLVFGGALQAPIKALTR